MPDRQPEPWESSAPGGGRCGLRGARERARALARELEEPTPSRSGAWGRVSPFARPPGPRGIPRYEWGSAPVRGGVLPHVQRGPRRSSSTRSPTRARSPGSSTRYAPRQGRLQREGVRGFLSGARPVVAPQRRHRRSSPPTAPRWARRSTRGGGGVNVRVARALRAPAWGSCLVRANLVITRCRERVVPATRTRTGDFGRGSRCGLN
jgi:hypothetical protein